MKWTITILTLIVLLTTGSGLFGQTPPVNLKVQKVTLAWDANTEADIVGYKLRWGTESGKYGLPINVGNVTTWTLDGLSQGTYYFVVTAYDADSESGYSNEVAAVISLDTITRAGVTYLTTTTAAISWSTRNECSGVVLWGTTNTLGSTRTANNLGTTDHFILLTGLLTKTHYFYRVTGVCSGINVTSPILTFNTK